MTRGSRRNIAFVFTLSTKIADPAPRPRPAPEIARYDRLQALRAGQPAAGPPSEADTTAVGGFAHVLALDGQEESATQSPRTRATPTTWPASRRSGSARPRPSRPRGTRVCS